MVKCFNLAPAIAQVKRKNNSEKYKHFKKSRISGIAIATHLRDERKICGLQSVIRNSEIYIRPYDMFVSEVDHKKYPDETGNIGLN